MEWLRLLVDAATGTWLVDGLNELNDES